MNVEVTSPSEFQGSVLTSLTKRHGVVVGQDHAEGFVSLFVEVGQNLNVLFIQTTDSS